MNYTTTIETSEKVILKPKKIVQWLALIVFVLLLANITGIILESVLQHESRFTRLLVRYFDFNLESNIPSFFSSVILLISGFLLLLIHTQQRKYSEHTPTKHWLILGFIFIFMAVDENVQLHEHIADFVRPQLGNDLSGLLHWAWVVPYAILTLVVVIYFIGFVLRLPPYIRNLIMVAGALFVIGALGLELVEGYIYIRYGMDHLYNRILYCLEELMEMSGVVLFIYALLHYLGMHRTQVSIMPDERSA